MKMLFAALAGALALAGNSVAQAQSYGYEYEYENAYADDRAWRSQLAASAHELSEEAAHLSHYLAAVDGVGYLADDAQALAGIAELFHDSVERGVPASELSAQFRSIDREHRRLRTALEHAYHVPSGAHTHEDWRAMVNAFARTARLMRQLSVYEQPAYAYERPAYGPRWYRPRNRGGFRIIWR